MSMGPQQQSIPSIPHIPLLQRAPHGAIRKDREIMSLGEKFNLVY